LEELKTQAIKYIMTFKKELMLILIFALILIAAIFGFRKLSQNPSTELKTSPAASKTEEAKKPAEPKIEDLVTANQDVFLGNRVEYKKMIGYWDTGCLIADPKNPLAEKHIFIFNENGTAQHSRLSGNSCETLQKEKTTNNYKIEIPAAGKINFIALNTDSDNIYDVYKAEINILYFGHGPRDWYPLSLRNFGGSLETRFDALNTFLKYKKQAQ
jgi:hypothetical protein